jgi:hypothetical protein
MVSDGWCHEGCRGAMQSVMCPWLQRSEELPDRGEVTRIIFRGLPLHIFFLRAPGPGSACSGGVAWPPLMAGLAASAADRRPERAGHRYA